MRGRTGCATRRDTLVEHGLRGETAGGRTRRLGGHARRLGRGGYVGLRYVRGEGVGSSRQRVVYDDFSVAAHGAARARRHGAILAEARASRGERGDPVGGIDRRFRERHAAPELGHDEPPPLAAHRYAHIAIGPSRGQGRAVATAVRDAPFVARDSLPFRTSGHPWFGLTGAMGASTRNRARARIRSRPLRTRRLGRGSLPVCRTDGRDSSCSASRCARAHAVRR